MSKKNMILMPRKMEASLSSIKTPFLKNVLQAYMENASLLIDGLARISTPQDMQPLQIVAHSYGKYARLLDMILMVGGASRYLPANDVAAAQHVRLSVEKLFAPHLQQQTKDTLVLNGLENTKIKTRSAIGTWIAKTFGDVTANAVANDKSAKNTAQKFSPIEEDNLLDAGKFDEAIEKYEGLLRAEPNEADYFLKLSMAYLMKGDDEKALEKLNKALGLKPNSADILVQLGFYHHIHREAETAAIHYSQALKIAPNHLLGLYRYGALLCEQRKTVEGIGLINKALRLQPDNIDFMRTKSHALLASGSYNEGWELYEHGLKDPDWRKTDLFANKPFWDGRPIPDKKLLLLSEQGLGDAIHFVRYAEECKKFAKKIYVLCRPPLAELFRTSPHIDKVFTGIGRWQFDMQISMMSLPHVLGTTLDNVPAHTPYLFVPANLKEKFYRKLELSKHAGKLKIGLVWSGSMFNNSVRGDLRAKRRNMELKQLLPLLNTENTIFCNLQLGDAAKEIDALGVRDRFVDAMDSVTNMLDTAAIVENIDLVISVDTSVAHLAGALAKPVWIMSRYDADWRWLHNRSDSPWYPTARIFGQPPDGDWDSVVKKIVEDLREYIPVG